jgi:hypothetical protein
MYMCLLLDQPKSLNIDNRNRIYYAKNMNKMNLLLLYIPQFLVIKYFAYY